jgi:hypothetical protein
MNDFTKQELQEIIESFDWIEGETSWDWKHLLRRKIQLMIDNFCEHEWVYNQHEMPIYCYNCKKDYR